MAINWGIIQQQPDFANALMTGYQQGQAMARQRTAQNALAALQANPDDGNALFALAGADADAARVIGQQQQARREEVQRQRTGALAGQAFRAATAAPPQAPMINKPEALPSGEVLPAMPADDAAVNGAVTPDEPGMMTVSAPRPEPGLPDILQTMVAEDAGNLPMAMKLMEIAQGRDERAKQAIADQQRKTAEGLYSVRSLPEAQRSAALVQLAPMIGMSAEEAAAIPVNDAYIDAAITQSIGVANAMKAAAQARDDDRADAQFGETVRSNRAREGLAAANLAVARGNLALRAREAGRGAGGPAARPAARLPVGEVNKLLEDARLTENLGDLRGTFDTRFSGVGTGAQNFAARLGVNLSDTSGEAADWWQRMDAFDNVVRNQLFGASLTAGEQAAWERTTVTPSMDPARIKANLGQREKLLARAFQRRRDALQGAGYDVGGVAAAVAPPARRSPAAPARQATPGPRVGTIDSGYRFKGGDPANRANWVKVNR